MARIVKVISKNSAVIYGNSADPSFTRISNGGSVKVNNISEGAQSAAIKAQLFDAGGAKVGAEFLVNVGSAINWPAKVVALANGGFVVAWEGSDNLTAQVFDANANKVGPEFLLDPNSSYDSWELHGLANGNFDVVYHLWIQDGGQVYETVGRQDFSVVPSDHAPIIISSGGGDAAGVSIFSDHTYVADVQATDVDVTAYPTYSIVGGADANLFEIDSFWGSLQFKAAPHFENPIDAGADNIYDVVVQVSSEGLTDTQSVAVTVRANQAPVIVSDGGGVTATISVPENTTAVTSLRAVDVDPSTTFHWTIIGGADANLFDIESFSGNLKFKAAPHFATPSDVGSNNVYDVVVQVSDGTLIDTQAIAVTVLKGVYGTSGKDILNGTAGDDVINGLGSVDSMDGKDGSDIYIISGSSEHRAAEIHDSGASGVDEVRFSALSPDTLRIYGGDTGLERVTIGTGTNTDADTSGTLSLNINASMAPNGLTITGNAGSNILTGTAFDDIIDGGTGADTMVGRGGSDTYLVDNTGDVVNEGFGGGIDTVRASVNYTLPRNVEYLTLTGPMDLAGTGNTLDNVIIGNAGNNLLAGGLGNDTLTGGAGSDSFIFNTRPNAVTNVDTINDFSHSDGDSIQLSQNIFMGLGGVGDLVADQFWSGADVTRAHDATDRIIYNTSTGDLYYDADGSAARYAAVLVAHLAGAPILLAADLHIIA